MPRKWKLSLVSIESWLQTNYQAYQCIVIMIVLLVTLTFRITLREQDTKKSHKTLPTTQNKPKQMKDIRLDQ